MLLGEFCGKRQCDVDFTISNENNLCAEGRH